jgi:hypothetical protein
MIKWILTFTLLFVPYLSSLEFIYSPPLLSQPPPTVDFKVTYDLIRQWEGNYVNHPHDRGGETYGGITRKYHPEWSGWKYINGKQLKRHEEVSEAEMWVLDFYLDIWIKEGFYSLKNQTLANALFDLRVHVGKRNTLKIVNIILQSMGEQEVAPGAKWVYSLETVDRWDEYHTAPTHPSLNIIVTNSSPVDIFLEKLKKYRTNYYFNIVNRDDTQKVFIQGWMNRLNSVIS